MDILNDQYPLYPPNPETSSISESEAEENVSHINRLDAINNGRKRKKNMTFDDFCMKYSDDIWYLWCTIKEYTNMSNLLSLMDYSTFCTVCYENSYKY
jgi:hypothetical protein